MWQLLPRKISGWNVFATKKSAGLFQITRAKVFLIIGVALLLVSPWFARSFAPVAQFVRPIHDAVAEEGFRFRQDAGVLTLRGTKSADLGLEIATRFNSMDPICRGMFATDTGDVNGVSKPMAGPAGRLNKLYYLDWGKDGDYEMLIPMQVTHPECDWRLVTIEVRVRSRFSTRNPRYGGASQFFLWSILKRDSAERVFFPDLHAFPEQIDAQCFNSIFLSTSKHTSCGAKGWNVNTSFPQTVTEQNQIITLNLLHHPEILDSDKWIKEDKVAPWIELRESQ